MLFSPKSLLSVGLFLGLGQAAFNATCATGVHMMVAGGCGVPCPADYPGILGNLISQMTITWPGSDVYFVPYNMSLKQGVVSTSVMTSAAQAYARQCPQTPMVFLGWSLGGIVVMNTMCSALSPYIMKNNVLGAVVYGEETYVGGMPYDAGTCAASAPKYPRNSTNLALCAPYASQIQSYCDASDLYCCSNGTSGAAHFAYSPQADTTAWSFISGKYANRTAAIKAKAAATSKKAAS